MNSVIKVWCSKYWRTKGLFELEGRVCESDPRFFISLDSCYYLGPNYWHRERIDAVLVVEKARKTAIKSLEKQLRTLKALRF